MEIPNEFFTLQTLGSISGLILAVWIIVQFTKDGIDFLLNKFLGVQLHTKIWVYIVTLFLMIGVQCFTSILSGENIFLMIVNSFLVATLAIKMHDTAKFGDKPEAKG